MEQKETARVAAELKAPITKEMIQPILSTVSIAAEIVKIGQEKQWPKEQFKQAIFVLARLIKEL